MRRARRLRRGRNCARGGTERRRPGQTGAAPRRRRADTAKTRPRLFKALGHTKIAGGGRRARLAQPDAQKAPQGISPPPQSAPPESALKRRRRGNPPRPCAVPEVKEEKEALNAGSTDDSRPAAAGKSKSEAAGTDDNTPENPLIPAKLSRFQNMPSKFPAARPRLSRGGRCIADAAERACGEQ